MSTPKSYIVDIEAISNDRRYIIASTLAKEVNRIGISNTGNLIAALPESVFNYFSMMVDHKIDDECFNTDVLLSTLVCLTSEGLEINDTDLPEQVSSFKLFMVTQQLARKGLVTVQPNKQSLGADAKHLVVAEITEKGRQTIKK